MKKSLIGDDRQVTSSTVSPAPFTLFTHTEYRNISNSYSMVCPPVRRDNSRALASGLSQVLVHNHAISILYHVHYSMVCPPVRGDNT